MSAAIWCGPGRFVTADRRRPAVGREGCPAGFRVQAIPPATVDRSRANWPSPCSTRSWTERPGRRTTDCGSSTGCSPSTFTSHVARPPPSSPASWNRPTARIALHLEPSPLALVTDAEKWRFRVHPARARADGALGRGADGGAGDLDGVVPGLTGLADLMGLRAISGRSTRLRPRPRSPRSGAARRRR